VSPLTRPPLSPVLCSYCPQFDALQGTLTAREHLALFARIKGVKESLLPRYVQAMIDRLGLQAGIEDRPSKAYSGGNKRKLSVGLALIGNPPIVFLDGPQPRSSSSPRSTRSAKVVVSS
jgi:ABC-type multidrug transport system ATPase subunit